MKLDPWQEEALAHDGDLLLATGRQVGKTLTKSRKCAEYMRKHPGCQIIIASLSEDQAQLIIIMILDYFEKNCPKEINEGKYRPTMNRVTLKNMSNALARPVGETGNAIRGFTGDVLVLDEVSRFNELIMLSAKPTLASTGGQIWMCSTFKGRKGYFYNCFLNKNKRFKVITANTEEVYRDRPISDEWTKERKEGALRFLEEEKKEMTKLQYAQEYLGEAVEDLKQFFSNELINKSCRGKRRPFTKGEYYLGCDVARMDKDEFTYEVIAMGSKLIHAESIVTRNIPIPESARRIIKLNEKYNFKKEFIDSGGMGITVCDILRENTRNRRKVVEINNASRSIDRGDPPRENKILKEDLYNNLLKLMEDDRIVLLDDDEVKASLRSIQAENDEFTQKLKIWGTDAHITEGLIRAAWCLKEKGLSISKLYGF